MQYTHSQLQNMVQHLLSYCLDTIPSMFNPRNIKFLEHMNEQITLRSKINPKQENEIIHLYKMIGLGDLEATKEDILDSLE